MLTFNRQAGYQISTETVCQNFNKSRFTLPPLSNQLYLRAEIEQYSLRALKRLIKCSLPACSNCSEASSTFKPHEVRPRTFYIIVDQVKESATCMVIRFKCPSCGKTATQLPDFALPGKRYVLPTILHFTRNYVDNDYTTYRSLLCPDFIGWNNSEKQFAHTSTFHWIATLGNMPGTLAQAQFLIMQRQTDSTISTDVIRLTIASRKCHKPHRRHLLIQCRRLHAVDTAFKAVFSRSIFGRTP